MYELIAEQLSGSSTYVNVNDDMQRGLDLEDEAVGVMSLSLTLRPRLSDSLRMTIKPTVAARIE
jgi:hypothetical protein